ncbi:MAG: alanine racemase [Desulfovibrionaceae bacterium]|nr:alanine racemase [Desulfovibrionaceae bacterium]MBF0514393.1 alanine racemase [Desulfovibrionaceae bacterium]
MSIAFNTLTARIDLAAVAANYELLRARAPGAVPVVKADAYGHGLYPVAWALSRAGARTLAVGTVAEAVHLRALPFAGEILALLGPIREGASEPADPDRPCGPCDTDDYELILAHGVTALIHDLAQLERLGTLAAARGVPAKAALKFDTGMGRLGFSRKDASRVIAALAKYPALTPVMLCSHLATADDAEDEAYATAQGEAFGDIVEKFALAGISLEVSLANSAAILSRPDLALGTGRAGIALYGANPFWDTPKAALGANLKPAMSVAASVIAVHDLPAGAGISYGLTYTAARDMRVAVVQAGYADAYSRLGSNTALMHIRGARVPVVGRVCMQLTAVDVSRVPGVRPGDVAWLLGGQGDAPIRAEELAAWWRTIPYEVFCLLGMNTREYV